uniref:WXG100-like domain-containing protein n=1 Tax=Catenulispora rubra TaxID=280293 RepID=UPI00189227F4
MSISIPPELDWVAALAVGQAWPAGDEDQLSELGDAWRDTHSQLTAINHDISPMASGMRDALSGPTAEQFGSFVKQLNSTMPTLVETTAQMGDMSHETAVQTQYSKLMILLQLAWMAEQIIEWAPTVYGLALVPEIEAVGRLVVSQVAKRFVTSVASATAIQTGMDAAVQAFQMFVLKDRDHWDVSSTVGAVEMGLLSGGIGAAVHEIGDAIAPELVNSFKGKVITATATGLTSAVVSNAVFGGNQDLGLALSSGLFGGVLGAKGPHERPKEPPALDLGSLHELGELVKKVEEKDGLPGFETTLTGGPKTVEVVESRPALESSEPHGGPGSGPAEAGVDAHPNQVLSSHAVVEGPPPIAEHSSNTHLESTPPPTTEHSQSTSPDTVANSPLPSRAFNTASTSDSVAAFLPSRPPERVARSFAAPAGDAHDWSVARPIEAFTDEAHAGSFLSNFGVGSGRTLHLRDALDPASVPQERAALELLPDRSGRLTVAVHGDVGRVVVGDHELSPKALAQVVRSHPDWPQVEQNGIRLVACDTGATPEGGQAFAQHLSDELGVPVVAPTKKVWTSHDGMALVADPNPRNAHLPLTTAEGKGAFHDFTPAQHLDEPHATTAEHAGITLEAGPGDGDGGVAAGHAGPAGRSGTVRRGVAGDDLLVGHRVHGLRPD